MLTSFTKNGHLRRADNLLPLRDGSMESRPGAKQLIDGKVSGVVEWGERLVIERNGRIGLLSGAVYSDLTTAGKVLRGTNFQALTANAQREDRLYIADGLRKLWYIAWRSGAPVIEQVENSVLDGNSVPYVIPVPTTVTTWRRRLFIGYGQNRVQHCQLDAPEEWDPIWTLEFQTEKQDKVLALTPFGATLIVNQEHSAWSVSGDSHLNFESDQASEVGAQGASAVASDGSSVFRISREGVFTLSGECLSDDIEDFFGAPAPMSSCVVDIHGRRLFVAYHGRLFVCHLDTKRWGEIRGYHIAGVFSWNGRVGWYGDDGVWLLEGRDLPDRLADNSPVEFSCVFDMWENRPNLGGDGRAECRDTVIHCQGSSRGNATYTVWVDGEQALSEAVSLADEDVDNWADDIEAQTPQYWPTRPVRRDFIVQESGESFRHKVESACYMRVFGVYPSYRFKGQ